ncbi:gastrokine-1-like isoform X2 [Phyllobates terribilis]|uniref:gastrokine-1-like isoform X2 n=1 Tax=Phyllobates terribilis TaxID=111132 RepID=UPI003CCAA997
MGDTLPLLPCLWSSSTHRMKAVILLAALLGVVFATDNININNQGNDGDNVHQTVNIDNHNNIANINHYNGWNSWNSMWDYGNGMFAVRLMATRHCVVSKMNRNVVPSLEQLQKASQERQNPNAPPPRSLSYTITQTKVKNVAQFGNHIESLCKGVPTFFAQENQGSSFFVDLHGCTDLGILRFLGISLCGNIGC